MYKLNEAHMKNETKKSKFTTALVVGFAALLYGTAQSHETECEVETYDAWVLLISSWNSNRNEVEQLGNYATEGDCLKVQKLPPFSKFNSFCTRVKLVR